MFEALFGGFGLFDGLFALLLLFAGLLLLLLGLFAPRFDGFALLLAFDEGPLFALPVFAGCSVPTFPLPAPALELAAPDEPLAALVNACPLDAAL